MSWQGEMTIILRVMLNDLAAATYTDQTLQQSLVVAAQLVKNELDFPIAYTTDVVNVLISPDPTIAPNRNENFINLACLKAACVSDRGQASISTGIMVKDGSSVVDLREQFKGKLELLKQGWCKAYSDAKFEYQSGLAGIAGAAIMTPFRVFATNGAYGIYPYEGRSFYNPFP